MALLGPSKGESPKDSGHLPFGFNPHVGFCLSCLQDREIAHQEEAMARSIRTFQTEFWVFAALSSSPPHIPLLSLESLCVHVFVFPVQQMGLAAGARPEPHG